MSWSIPKRAGACDVRPDFLEKYSGDRSPDQYREYIDI
jgi:hypothetical protein